MSGTARQSSRVPSSDASSTTTISMLLPARRALSIARGRSAQRLRVGMMTLTFDILGRKEFLESTEPAISRVQACASPLSVVCGGRQLAPYAQTRGGASPQHAQVCGSRRAQRANAERGEKVCRREAQSAARQLLGGSPTERVGDATLRASAHGAAHARRSGLRARERQESRLVSDRVAEVACECG